MLLTGNIEGTVTEAFTQFVATHGRSLLEAGFVMVLVWFTVEWLLGWLPKAPWATGIKRFLTFFGGLTALVVLDELAIIAANGGVVEMAHHGGSWTQLLYDHMRPLFYGVLAGGLTVYLHPWIKSKMPAKLVPKPKEVP